MKTASVTKAFYFCAGHQLPGHLGKCKNVHGHNYKAEVTVEGNIINQMVMDYGDLKKLVKPIIEEFDHGFFVSPETPKWLISGLQEDNMKVYFLGERATTEAIAYELLALVTKKFPDSIFKVSIKLWESESSFAVVSYDSN
jgi:6-pyruvoyltetrahydropterin/6-carboxytetrahydropterin synthase